MFYKDPIAWSRQVDEPYWGALMGDNPTPHHNSGVGLRWSSLLADMDAAGIDKVVLQGIYFQHHQNCVDQK